MNVSHKKKYKKLPNENLDLLRILSFIKTKNNMKIKILGMGDLKSKIAIECDKISISAEEKIKKLRLFLLLLIKLLKWHLI